MLLVPWLDLRQAMSLVGDQPTVRSAIPETDWRLVMEQSCQRRVEVHWMSAKVPAMDRAGLVKGLRTVVATAGVCGQVRCVGWNQ